MKKFYTFLVIALGMITLQSCVKEEIIQNNNVEVQVIELTNVNFTSANGYSRLFEFNPAILDNDMVLVYLLDSVSNNTDIWRPLPQVYYLTDNLGPYEVRYNFDFTRFDVRLFMTSDDWSAVTSDYTLNQIFRVVILPGYRTRSSSQINLDNFDEVVKAYNIDLSKIKKVKM